MQKIVLASANEHKIKEFKQVFKGFEIVPMSEFGFTQDIVEDGKTFFENALIKAKAVSTFLKEKGLSYPVVADDSGLCVNSLKGEPGINSARYAGDHDIQANREKLLKKLKTKEDRSAYFNCTLVMYMPDDSCIFAEGKTEGHILDAPEGESGFAYDPLFYSNDLNKSFGLATANEKNKVSHRGRAIKNLLAEYKKYQERIAENNPAKTLESKTEWIRAVKFVLFSISAGAIQLITDVFFNEVCGFVPWLSYIISLTLSVLWNFTLNREFTFKSASNVPIAMFKIFCFYLVFAPLSTWWTAALSTYINEYIILAGTMIINFITEFLFSRYFIYKDSLDTNTRAKTSNK